MYSSGRSCRKEEKREKLPPKNYTTWAGSYSPPGDRERWMAYRSHCPLSLNLANGTHHAVRVVDHHGRLHDLEDGEWEQRRLLVTFPYTLRVVKNVPSWLKKAKKYTTHSSPPLLPPNIPKAISASNAAPTTVFPLKEPRKPQKKDGGFGG